MMIDVLLLSFQDMGTVIMGKVESGGVMKGTSLMLMPNRVSKNFTLICVTCSHLATFMCLYVAMLSTWADVHCMFYWYSTTTL